MERLQKEVSIVGAVEFLTARISPGLSFLAGASLEGEPLAKTRTAVYRILFLLLFHAERVKSAPVHNCLLPIIADVYFHEIIRAAILQRKSVDTNGNLRIVVPVRISIN